MEENFGCDGYISSLDCDDGFTVVYLSPNSASFIHYV